MERRKKVIENHFNLFVDCGAPSLFNKFSKASGEKTMGAFFKDRKYNDYSYVTSDMYIQYREAYIKFIHKYKDKIDIYSNLDVIGNPKLTWRNQKYLESMGINPIPVFHIGTDTKWLKMYLDNYNYIAIGGLAPNPTRVVLPILDRLFKDYLLDAQGYPRANYHGFACTSIPLMLRFPWYSVDSASSKKLAAYGKIFVPTNGYAGATIISVSGRDIKLEHKVSKGIIQRLDRYLKDYGFTIEDIRDSSYHREVWNHLVLLRVVYQSVGDYPWSMYNTVENKGATGSDNTNKLHIYHAGSFCRKGETLFWNTVEKYGVPFAVRRRLSSFFYERETIKLMEFNEHKQKSKK